MKSVLRLIVLMITALSLLEGCKRDVISEEPHPHTPSPKPNPGGPDDTVVYNPTFFDLPVFPTLPQAFIPEDNRMSHEAVALGKKLFFEKRLSGNNTQSCASCHKPDEGFADARRFSEGITGAIGSRNAMAIINLAYGNFFFWDGRSKSLEEQALDPITDPIEMNANWSDVLVTLNEDTAYRNGFKRAYNVDVIDSSDVAKAIAQFERTLISSNSKFDRERIGQYQYTELEQKGFDLFVSDTGGDCFHCHQVGTFTGFDFENNGLQDVLVDKGVGDVTGRHTDDGKFKAPTLRNIEFTSPYMHDGRFNTLEEVIEFYDSGVNMNSPNISPNMSHGERINGDLNLTVYEKEALVAFLKTLTDESFINNPDFRP